MRRRRGGGCTSDRLCSGKKKSGSERRGEETLSSEKQKQVFLWPAPATKLQRPPRFLGPNEALVLSVQKLQRVPKAVRRRAGVLPARDSAPLLAG